MVTPYSQPQRKHGKNTLITNDMKAIIKNWKVHGYYDDSGARCYWGKPMSIFRFYWFRKTVKKYITQLPNNK